MKNVLKFLLYITITFTFICFSIVALYAYKYISPDPIFENEERWYSNSPVIELKGTGTNNLDGYAIIDGKKTYITLCVFKGSVK